MRGPARRRRPTDVVTAGGHPPVGDGEAGSAEDVTRGERWHRSARSGTLRAVIFGVSDGLVSNLSLVMGVAGASGQGGFILLAGIAGLLAGAFSMAAGEYISMQSQRELFERQIELERAELEAMPEEEQRELAAIYVAKGFPRDEADRIAARMFRDPADGARHARPRGAGPRPRRAGLAMGRGVRVVPGVRRRRGRPGGPVPRSASGQRRVRASAWGSASWRCSASVRRSACSPAGACCSAGFRQMAIGAAAAAVTYAVGTIIGVGVAG